MRSSFLHLVLLPIINVVAFCPLAPTTTFQSSTSITRKHPFFRRNVAAVSEETTTSSIASEAEARMEKAIFSIQKKLSTVQTSRPNPTILDPVRIKYYGAPTPLNQLATISVLPGRLITVEPYDKSILNNIEKAIAEGDLDLNPSNDGTVIRLSVPELTEDRRKMYLKKCKGAAEDGKVSVRNIRRDANDQIKKLESSVGKDGTKSAMDELQKLTDKYTKKVSDLVERKEKELMTI
eukprot:CAMPEP_0172510042 /NCGR_PEP_ID=MMETSP1066-20121228/225660_1 /TAXON_ID=671091 /ORGANISM="Coscinodiscus wailesii, Strain CCMP2513" /LENGTH=235 /DNA_ID=CAMNT_0013288835 /DNA_START=71 /DNA_END=778 /DNA_ORIENTATION=-